MSPSPSGRHQDFNGELYSFLRRYWAKPTGGLVRFEVNLTTPADEARWTTNYRCPDLVLVAADRRAAVDKDKYLVGPPTVVVEIESPDDDTRDKLPFYAGLGVPEVWVFDRDTKGLERLVLAAAGYAPVAADAAGWHVSPATGVRFRPTGVGTVWAQVGAAAEELPDG